MINAEEFQKEKRKILVNLWHPIFSGNTDTWILHEAIRELYQASVTDIENGNNDAVRKLTEPFPRIAISEDK